MGAVLKFTGKIIDRPARSRSIKALAFAIRVAEMAELWRDDPALFDRLHTFAELEAEAMLRKEEPDHAERTAMGGGAMAGRGARLWHSGRHMAGMKSAVYILILGIALGAALGALAGCATYRGVQQDVHRATNPNWR